MPAVSHHYPNHLQTHWLMHEDYLYSDISLHSSYRAQCSVNLEQILKSILDLSWRGLKNHGPPPSVCLFFFAESNYKMPQLPILSQRCVIKKPALSCPCLCQVIGGLQKD